MNSVGRRLFLGTGLVSAGVALAYGSVALRLNSTPRRHPDLTDTKLVNLRETMAEVSSPRVLVVGNSATIRSGFFEHLSAADPPATDAVNFARASADGARLIDTLRISKLRKLLRDVEWNVVVMQDFSATPLNFGDRQASTLAIKAMAKLASPASVVLFPHWPSAPGHRVYDGKLGSRLVTPKNLTEYAARIQAHYESAAEKCNGRVAPVLEDWQAAIRSGADLYLKDRHHANQRGAKLAAEAVWRTISQFL